MDGEVSTLINITYQAALVLCFGMGFMGGQQR